MSYQTNQIYNGTLVAGEDLRTHQFKAVKVNAASALVLAGAGESMFGIVQGKPNIGHAVKAAVSGFTKAKAGGTIAAGADVGVGAGGVFVTYATGVKVGKAVMAAVSGDVFTLDVRNVI